jgi:crotonobetainyl-CoA:carnitine CoA-transferase CaiB-like acyl-CoA transferase
MTPAEVQLIENPGPGRGDLPGPLAGVTVLESTTNASGPVCAQTLGDLGADVIKLESLQGDPVRHMPPFHQGQSGLFAQFNRNKRSVAVDLRTPGGLDIAQRLARRADVFIENARPGALEKLGLGYADLNTDNPSLVYLSINGYGDDGPYRDMPAYDQVVQGLTGFAYQQGGDGPPALIRAGIVDKVTAIYGALAVLSALLHVRGGGKGQRINVNLLDAYSAFALPEQIASYTFREQAPATAGGSSINVFHLLKTKDGYASGLVQFAQLRQTCVALDREDLLTDPRFSGTGAVMVHQKELFDELSTVTRTMTKAELSRIALRHRLPIAPVNNYDEYFDDPQVQHNQSYLDFPDPELGPMRLLKPFANFPESPTRVYRRAPRLGEHTGEVLREIGFTDAMIDEARKSGLIGLS